MGRIQKTDIVFLQKSTHTHTQIYDHLKKNGCKYAQSYEAILRRNFTELFFKATITGEQNSREGEGKFVPYFYLTFLLFLSFPTSSRYN